MSSPFKAMRNSAAPFYTGEQGLSAGDTITGKGAAAVGDLAQRAVVGATKALTLKDFMLIAGISIGALVAYKGYQAGGRAYAGAKKYVTDKVASVKRKASAVAKAIKE